MWDRQALAHYSQLSHIRSVTSSTTTNNNKRDQQWQKCNKLSNNSSSSSSNKSGTNKKRFTYISSIHSLSTYHKYILISDILWRSNLKLKYFLKRIFLKSSWHRTVNFSYLAMQLFQEMRFSCIIHKDTKEWDFILIVFSTLTTHYTSLYAAIIYKASAHGQILKHSVCGASWCTITSAKQDTCSWHTKQ